MPPSVVNGFMMSCAQLYSCLFSFFQAFLLQKDQRYGLAAMTISVLITGLLTLCIDETKGREGLKLGIDDDSQASVEDATNSQVSVDELDEEDN